MAQAAVLQQLQAINAAYKNLRLGFVPPAGPYVAQTVAIPGFSKPLDNSGLAWRNRRRGPGYIPSDVEILKVYGFLRSEHPEDKQTVLNFLEGLRDMASGLATTPDPVFMERVKAIAQQATDRATAFAESAADPLPELDPVIACEKNLDILASLREMGLEAPDPGVKCDAMLPKVEEKATKELVEVVKPILQATGTVDLFKGFLSPVDLSGLSPTPPPLTIPEARALLQKIDNIFEPTAFIPFPGLDGTILKALETYPDLVTLRLVVSTLKPKWLNMRQRVLDVLDISGYDVVRAAVAHEITDAITTEWNKLGHVSASATDIDKMRNYNGSNLLIKGIQTFVAANAAALTDSSAPKELKDYVSILVRSALLKSPDFYVFDKLGLVAEYENGRGVHNKTLAEIGTTDPFEWFLRSGGAPGLVADLVAATKPPAVVDTRKLIRTATSANISQELAGLFNKWFVGSPVAVARKDQLKHMYTTLSSIAKPPSLQKSAIDWIKTQDDFFKTGGRLEVLSGMPLATLKDQIRIQDILIIATMAYIIQEKLVAPYKQTMFGGGLTQKTRKNILPRSTNTRKNLKR